MGPAMGGGKGKGCGVDGTLPRRNVKSFAGNAQFGDRNRGMVDWQAVFDEERKRERERNAHHTAPKRPPLNEISETEMSAMAEAWAAKAGPAKKKKKKKRKVEGE